VISASRVLRLALVSAAGAVYLGLGYLTAASERAPLLGIFIGITPLGAVALVAAWHSRARALALLACVACAALFVLNLDQLRSHAAWLYFVQHAGAMTLLCIAFGSTLAGAHSAALCSRIASVVISAPLDASYFRYTWKVTLAWTIFFGVVALVSVLLFFLGPIELWSVFANLLTAPLLGAMFVGEYLVRQRVLPDRPHVSVVETIRAYQEFSRRKSAR
jgi:uncharacterized membrane protein